MQQKKSNKATKCIEKQHRKQHNPAEKKQNIGKNNEKVAKTTKRKHKKNSRARN